MAELITGRGGTDHVDSEDFGAFNAVTLGDGTYILSGCSMAMKTANTLHIAAGELLMQGRHVRIKGSGEDVDVAVGTTGYNRNDIVALHYKQEGGIESVSVEVVAGTPTTGAASDPELGGGSILNGDSEAYAAIARVPIAGLVPSEPVVLVGGLKSNSQLAESISALGDSVSRTPLTVADVKSGFAVKAWKTQLGVQIDVTGSSNTLIQSGEEWGYEIAKIPAVASLTLCGLVGMMWTEGANSNDLMWFHMSDGSLRVDFKSKTKDWPKTIHCDGIMAYS
jgi:hypothetical protein